MHRKESDEWVPCNVCGAVIQPSADRGFTYGERGVLCWECAIRRGGSYDSDEDRWSTAPDVVDLPDERRPHP